MNLNPVTQLDQNYSWQIQISAMNKWAHDLSLAGGYSFNLNLLTRSRLAYFLSARSLVEQDAIRPGAFSVLG